MQIETQTSHDTEASRALRAIRYREDLRGLDKIRRAATLLDGIMFADVVANADPALWQVRKDLREGIAEATP